MFQDMTEAQKWAWIAKSVLLLGVGGIAVYALVKK